jgi:predicted Zn-dependent protease
MGHELAHVTERHSIKSLEDQLAVAGLLDLVLGESSSAEVVGTIYGFFSATTFSQDHETEADVVGVQVSHDAGYNPHGLADFFERLLALEGDTIDLSFLSSHPANAERIARVTAEIAQRYGAGVTEGQTQSYTCLGTDLTFEQLKAHLTSGAVAITPGTGVGLPEGDGGTPADGAQSGDAGAGGDAGDATP